MPVRLLLAAACSAALAAAAVSAADPLHARIDAAIEAKAKADKVAVSPVADDAEFLRRAWLDFAGKVPPAGVTKAFLADTDAAKRAKMIARLAGGPEYAGRMTDLFGVMLMERLGENADWSKYLTASFAANKPWDAMAREMLRADPKNEAAKGASFFLSKRLENYGGNPVEYSALTRDVGRLFLGKNFQCCECHDHLFVDDYKQQHFQGLHAFFKNTFLVAPGGLQVGEKPVTEKTTFASVFTKVEMTTGPSLPEMMMVSIPSFPKGQEYAEAPDRKTKNPGVPKFSTLQAVSEQLPRASNKDFTRNIVNRLWFAVMGRGLVHPLDLHHSRNPGSHPELLDLLADEFAAHKFDIKWLLTELALSKTYQRSSLLPAGVKEPAAPEYFATALERRLTADQLLASMLEATGADAKAAALRPKFLKAYANQPREPEDEVAPMLKAALFVLHDDAVLGMLKPTPGGLVDRLAKLDKLDTAADELYVAVLSRPPTADERATVVALLAKHPDQKADALGRAAWALLASMEFGVNH